MNRRPLISYAVVACVLALTAAPAAAQSTWIGGLFPGPPDPNNWDDPDNWSGDVPSSILGGIVNSTAFPAIGTGTNAVAITLDIGIDNNPVGPGGPRALVVMNNSNLTVGQGLRVGNVTGLVNARGQLTGSSFGLTVGDELLVGIVDGDGNATGAVAASNVETPFAVLLQIGVSDRAGIANGSLVDTTGTGSLTTSGVRAEIGVADDTGNATGLLRGVSLDASGTSLDIGVAGAEGSADGTLEAFGNFLADALRVGVSNGAGNANGSVVDTTGTGSLLGNLEAKIGVADDSGSATGLLQIGSLDVSTTNLDIGFATSMGSADGMVEAAGVVSARRLEVGINQGSGVVTGSLTAAGGLTVELGLNVGVVSSFFGSDATGDATGTVTAVGVNSTSTMDFLGIGVSFGEGNADGSVVNLLGTGLLTVDGQARIGVARDMGNAMGLLRGVSLDASGTELQIGVAEAAGFAVGTLEAFGDVSANEMIVGVSDGAGTANGTLEATGTVSATGLVDVGVSEASGAATGSLTAGSGLMVGGRLQVGVAEGAGNADGTLEATGGLTVELGLNVGVVSSVFGSDATGDATGRLILHDNMTATVMTVGRSSGVGTAIGEITLDNAIITVEDITLGEGSNVMFDIDGFLRGDEYGAIDVDSAAFVFGGVAEARFNFIPTAGTHQFDLIRGPTIQPTFYVDGTSFNVFGLDSGFTWFTDLVTESAMRVFRLTIEGDPVGDGNTGDGNGGDGNGGGGGGNGVVPEPMTATLALMGLGVLGMATRRRVAA